PDVGPGAAAEPRELLVLGRPASPVIGQPDRRDLEGPGRIVKRELQAVAVVDDAPLGFDGEPMDSVDESQPVESRALNHLQLEETPAEDGDADQDDRREEVKAPRPARPGPDAGQLDPAAGFDQPGAPDGWGGRAPTPGSKRNARGTSTAPSARR